MVRNMSDVDRHRIRPGQNVDLRKLKTDGRDFEENRDRCEREFLDQRTELVQLQEKLYAEEKQKLLIVFKAMDGGGKDGTIRSVFEGVNPQGVVVTSFKKPSEEELAHDFLWRIHKAVP